MTHGYEWNLERLKIFNSAYDADKAWVKELIIEKKIDWLWMCIVVYMWMVKAFHKLIQSENKLYSYLNKSISLAKNNMSHNFQKLELLWLVT